MVHYCSMFLQLNLNVALCHFNTPDLKKSGFKICIATRKQCNWLFRKMNLGEWLFQRYLKLSKCFCFHLHLTSSYVEMYCRCRHEYKTCPFWWSFHTLIIYCLIFLLLSLMFFDALWCSLVALFDVWMRYKCIPNCTRNVGW